MSVYTEVYLYNILTGFSLCYIWDSDSHMHPVADVVQCVGTQLFHDSKWSHIIYHQSYSWSQTIFLVLNHTSFLTNHLTWRQSNSISIYHHHHMQLLSYYRAQIYMYTHKSLVLNLSKFFFVSRMQFTEVNSNPLPIASKMGWIRLAYVADGTDISHSLLNTTLNTATRLRRGTIITCMDIFFRLNGSPVFMISEKVTDLTWNPCWRASPKRVKSKHKG